MPTKRIYFRKIRRAVWYSLVAVIVTTAVLMSLARVFLSDVTTYREEIERIASTFLEHTVRIDSLDAKMVGFTPTLVFKNVHMMDENNKFELVSFDEAHLGVALFSSIRQKRIVPSEFTIIGIQLAVTRRMDGRFLVQGIDVSKLEETFAEGAKGKTSSALSDWLFRRSRLAMRNSILIWKDLKRQGKTLRFDNVNLELRNDNLRHQLNGKLSIPEDMGRHFELALDVTGDVLNPLAMQGHIYVQGDGIHLDKWGVKPEYLDVALHQGVADFRLWGDWRNGGLHRLSGDVTTYNVDLTLPIMDKPFKVKLLGGLFDVIRNDNGWSVNVNRFHYMGKGGVWPETRFSVLHQYGNEKRPSSTEIKTGYFRLEDITALLLKTNVLEEKQRDMLKTFQFAGDVRDLQFKHIVQPDNKKEMLFQARFEHMASQPWQSIPGMHGMQGAIWSDLNKGKLVLDTEYSTLEFPKLFRWPLQITNLNAEFNWRDRGDSWQLWADEIVANNSDINTNSSILLELPKSGASPYMDMQLSFRQGNGENAERYYPVGIMSKQVVDWLDKGIVSGRIKQGGAVFNGRFSDFPFKRRQGKFMVEFDGDNVVIDYLKKWPKITHADIAGEISGKGMVLDIHKAKVIKSTISKTQVRIDRFTEPRLEINGQVDGKLRDVAYFLVDSPIRPEARDFVKSMRFAGNSHTNLNISVPLSAAVEKISPLGFSGDLILKNAAVYLMGDRLDIKGLAGKISFNEKGQEASAMKAKILGGEVKIDVYTQKNLEGRPVQLIGSGVIDAHRLMKRFELPGYKQFRGKTEWMGVLTLGGKQNKKSLPPELRLTSRLKGVKIDLPVPLDKKSDSERAFSMTSTFINENRSELSLDYANDFSWAMELVSSNDAIHLGRSHLHLASGKAKLPNTKQLRVTGSLHDFSLANWVKALETKKSKGKQTFFIHPVVLDMDTLQIARFGEQPEHNKESDTIKPAELPIFKGKIQQLMYDEAALGQAEFSMKRLRRGLQLDKLVLTKPDMKLTGSGQWTYQRRRHRSKLDLALDSKNMGKLMKELGFSAIISDGELQAKGDLDWSAAPHQFALGKVKGKINLNIEKGGIINVKPGAGRLIGLLSLSALPRRLMLDFRDTFKEGFSFDRIDGEIKLEKGQAYSKHISITSPLAEISIKGRTGLVDKDYDQYVTVIPQVGDTLPVAGGLLFGTQIGAVILLFEKLMGKEIEKATAREYHITGTWDKPNIERLDEDEVEESEQDEAA